VDPDGPEFALLLPDERSRAIFQNFLYIKYISDKWTLSNKM